MNRILFIFLITIVCSSSVVSQEKIYALTPCDSLTLNLDEEVSYIDWQTSIDGLNWNSLLVGEPSILISGKDYFGEVMFRAELVLLNDSCIDYTQTIRTFFNPSVHEFRLKDYYDGHIFSSSNDSILVGNIHGQFERYPWGCNNTKIFEGSSEGSDSGLENTRVFLEKCSDTLSAFRIIDQYYQDPENIFIPSLKELALFDEIVLAGDDRNGSWWSSNERNNYLAYLYDSQINGLVNTDKVNPKNLISGKLITNPICQNFQVELDVRERVNDTDLIFQRDSTFTNVFVSNSDITLNSNYNYTWDWGNSYSNNIDPEGKITLEYKWRNNSGWHDQISIIDPSTTCETVFISNTIKPEFYTKSQTLRSISNGDISMADFNNDGQEDIVITQSDILFYQNESGEFDIILTIPDTLFESTIITPDINNDGLADILVMGSVDGNPEVHSYINKGDFEFEQTDNPFTGQLSGDIETIDLNNDGVLEILISGMDQDSVPSFSVYAFNDSKEEYEIIPSQITGLFNCEIVVEDIDGDQFSDILLLGKNEEGRHTFIFMNEEGQLSQLDNDIIPLSDGDAVFFHFNDDEYLDVAATGEKADIILDVNGNSISVDPRPAGTLNIYTQDSTNQFSLVQSLQGEESFYNSAVDVGDYDGDGDVDLFISGGAGGIQWSSTGIGGGTPNWSKRALTSVLNKNNPGGFTTIRANTSGNLLLSYQPTYPTNFESKDIFSADFNNDSKIDFIRGGNGGSEGNGGIALSTDLFLNTSSCLNLPPNEPNSVLLIDSCDLATLLWEASLDDITSLGLTYQYYLKRVDSDNYIFSPANIHRTYSRSIQFNYLEHGEYVFGVKAIDGSKVSSPYTEFAFTVQAPVTPEISYNGNEICAEPSDGFFEWFFNGEFIDNENTNCITPIEFGEYYCIAQSNDCVSDPSNIILYDSSLDVNTPLFEKISLSPNPVRDILYLETEFNFKNLEIYNTVGQRVWSGAFRQAIDVSALQAGTYKLMGDREFVGRFVKM